MGICLGYQIIGLACGARTIKMTCGHHGANHPVIDVTTSRVYITSQNHGFAVNKDSLKSIHRITHKSLFDESLQGIELIDKYYGIENFSSKVEKILFNKDIQ